MDARADRSTSSEGDRDYHRTPEEVARALCQLGSRLNIVTEEGEAARIILDIAQDVFGWDACAFDLWKPGSKYPHPILYMDTIDGVRQCVSTTHVSLEPSRRARRVLDHGAELINQWQSGPFSLESVRFGDVTRESASVMIGPIRHGEKAVGLISLHSYSPHVYTAQDLQTFQAFADYCGGAMERIRSEDALRASEFRYGALCDVSSVGIWHIDLKGHTIYANNAMCELLQVDSMTDLANHTFHRYFTQASLDTVKVEHEKRVGQKVPGTYEVELIGARGARRNVIISGAPVLNGQGELDGMIGTFANVTEIRRSAREIKRLAAFVRRNPNPVFEFSAEGELTYFNEASMTLAKKLERRHPGDILPPDYAAMVRKIFAKAPECCNFQTQIGTRTLAWSFVPIPEERCVHCYSADVTDKISLEQQLRHAQKMDSIGRLAGGVAHDLNNVLTVVGGHASCLLAGEDLSENARESLHEIAQAAERSASLTRQLLLFSRREVLQTKRLDLNALVVETSRMLQRMVGETIQLRTRLEPDLPHMQGDHGMLQQVLLNLAVNARDAMPQGGVLDIATFTTAVRLPDEASQDKRLCLRVSDTGSGIRESDLPQIFEPFFTTKEVGKGTGLGLSIVYGIVRQHGGMIDVQSVEGKGTTFEVYFPITNQPLVQEESTTQLAARGGGETILLVEDEDSVRTLVAQVLEAYGYRVYQASNGDEAVEIWSRTAEDIDLLLSDVVMPGSLQGHVLAGKLRQERPELKVLLATGYSSEITGLGSAPTPATRCIPKPFTPRILLSAIRELLDEIPEPAS